MPTTTTVALSRKAARTIGVRVPYSMCGNGGRGLTVAIFYLDEDLSPVCFVLNDRPLPEELRLRADADKAAVEAYGRQLIELIRTGRLTPVSRAIAAYTGQATVRYGGAGQEYLDFTGARANTSSLFMSALPWWRWDVTGQYFPSEAIYGQTPHTRDFKAYFS